MPLIVDKIKAISEKFGIRSEMCHQNKRGTSKNSFKFEDEKKNNNEKKTKT